MDDAHGVMRIHSCPSALAQHVEWTLSHVLGTVIRLDWRDQPALERGVRTELDWTGAAGSAARLASAMRGWNDTRFEVTESTGPNRDGVRYVHTPSLGVFYTLTDAIGNAMVGEDRIRYVMELAAGDALELERELRIALGTVWDDELEPYRATRFIPSLVGDASRAG
jgi:hypothetical protein